MSSTNQIAEAAMTIDHSTGQLDDHTSLLYAALALVRAHDEGRDTRHERQAYDHFRRRVEADQRELQEWIANGAVLPEK